MSEELEEFEGKFYPKWIMTIALSFRSKMHKAGFERSLGESTKAIFETVEALESADQAQPSEPIRAIISIPAKKEESNE